MGKLKFGVGSIINSEQSVEVVIFLFVSTTESMFEFVTGGGSG